MHRLQHFVGHGGGSGDGQKFPARANGHFLVFLVGRYAGRIAGGSSWDIMRLRPSLRAQRSNPEPQIWSNCSHCSSQSQHERYFPSALRDRVPDLVLRSRWPAGSGSSTAGPSRFWQAYDQPQHPDLAVGVIEIAAAIAARKRRADAGDLIFRIDHAGVLQVGGEQRALGVDDRRLMWWVTAPVYWLTPTPRSSVAAPSQTGRFSSPCRAPSRSAHDGGGRRWRRSAFRTRDPRGGRDKRDG